MVFIFVNVPGLNDFAQAVCSVSKLRDIRRNRYSSVYRKVDSRNGISILKVQMGPSAVDRKSIHINIDSRAWRDSFCTEHDFNAGFFNKTFLFYIGSDTSIIPLSANLYQPSTQPSSSIAYLDAISQSRLLQLPVWVLRYVIYNSSNSLAH